MERSKIAPNDIRALKAQGGIPVLTAYDYPMTRLLDEAGIPVILVGDSLGMVVLGYPDTTHVTLEEMEHHVRAAARAKPRAVLVGDLPYQTYATPEQAVESARRLVAAGADAVKAEGGWALLPQFSAIIQAGVPFCGHLGMLPQSVVAEGGYKIKGRREEERAALLADAIALEKTGAFAIVLELVTPIVAGEIRRAVNIPTIGIGSGPDCDGQVLVTPDLLGAFPWFTPKFVQPKVRSAELSRAAIQLWMEEIK